ncbi:alpha/beta hydrolase [Bacillus sp. FJAT-45350]|uniref:alpha/beta hydrolase n=1 Tax=Bacillus sp. FJAT-45350 TaxID=2011014 RepID=UPI0027B9B514|nr:alpha/beta hydrolase [Bacillus sp. FJAT-45350]
MNKLKKVLYSILGITILFSIVLYIAVDSWATTNNGKLPPKTAVLLHAVNNNLVALDIEIPSFISSKSGKSTIVRENLTIPVSDGTEIPARIHRPKGEGPYPIILYYHGGAFMEGYGNIDTHDNITRFLAKQTKSVVISVGYRLAPEHVFPTAIEDSYDALHWAYENGESIHGDTSKIAVVGDSSGGNIATVVSAMARDRNGPDLMAQVLFYPLTTFDDVELESRNLYDSGYYLLSRRVMEIAREKYTPEETMWLSPYTSPLLSEDLTNLPPAYIVTAEFDPLRDEGEAYAERLAKSGVPVRAVRYEGVMHAFVSFYEVLYSGKHSLKESVSFINDAFADGIEYKPFELTVMDVPRSKETYRDDLEAYAFAAFLLGKETFSLFSFR